MKPNCYQCKYRGGVPGSAHSSCKHPAFDAMGDNPLFQLLAILGGGPSISSSECKVVGDPHGIRNGWFSHPLNFDPVWLQECSGYTPVEAPAESCPDEASR